MHRDLHGDYYNFCSSVSNRSDGWEWQTAPSSVIFWYFTAIEGGAGGVQFLQLLSSTCAGTLEVCFFSVATLYFGCSSCKMRNMLQGTAHSHTHCYTTRCTRASALCESDTIWSTWLTKGREFRECLCISTKQNNEQCFITIFNALWCTHCLGCCGARDNALGVGL